MKDENDQVTQDMFASLEGDFSPVDFDGKKHLVTKSNALVESARIRFNVMQHRILQTVLSQIKKGDDDIDKKMFEIPLKNVARLVGREVSGMLYKEVLQAARSLKTTPIIIKNDVDGQPLDEYLDVSMVQTVRYSKNHSGIIRIRFNTDVCPYISGLAKNYTQFSINNGLLFMTSEHAYRLHDFVARWGDVGVKTISLADFRWMMGIKETEYPRYNSFRERVIDVAVQQINEHSQFLISFEPRKIKRQVVAIEFKFRKKADPVKREKTKEGGSAKLDLGELVHGVPKRIIESRLAGSDSYIIAAKRIKGLRLDKESWSDFYRRKLPEIKGEQ